MELEIPSPLANDLLLNGSNLRRKAGILTKYMKKLIEWLSAVIESKKLLAL